MTPKICYLGERREEGVNCNREFRIILIKVRVSYVCKQYPVYDRKKFNFYT